MSDQTLNDRQEAFCQEYLIDLNGAQAAIRAGYSENGANSKASQLLAIVNVQNRIAELKAERAERVQVDADYMLKRLLAEAEADLGDLYNEHGSMKPIHEWPKIWRQGLLAGLDVHQEYIYEGGKKKPDGVVMKAKLADRVKRLEMLGRHIGFFNDKLTLEGGDSPLKVDSTWNVSPVKVVGNDSASG